MNNLRLAERILGKYGFTVKTADSGISALQLAREIPDPKLSQIPIIAMTANAFASDVQAAIDAGMNGHIAKPFLPKDLVSIISANLSS